MTLAKSVSGLAVLSALAALAVPSHGQSPSARTGSELRLRAWQKELVLPQNVTARLTFAERRLQPSGSGKLETMAQALAPAIASGSDFDPLRNKAVEDIARAFPGLAAMDVSEAAFIVMAMAAKDMDDDIRTIMAEIRATNSAKQKMRDLIQELDEWISREMSKHPGSEDLDNEKATGSKTPAAAARPAASAKVSALRRMTFETKISPVIHLEYVKAPVVPPLPPRRPGLTIPAIRSLRDDIESNLDGLNEMSELTSLRLQMMMERRSKFIQTLSNMMKKTRTTQERLVQNIK